MICCKQERLYCPKQLVRRHCTITVVKMLNRCVLSQDQKTATEGAEVTRSGRLFQTRALTATQVGILRIATVLRPSKFYIRQLDVKCVASAVIGWHARQSVPS